MYNFQPRHSSLPGYVRFQTKEERVKVSRINKLGAAILFIKVWRMSAHSSCFCFRRHAEWNPASRSVLKWIKHGRWEPHHLECGRDPLRNLQGHFEEDPRDQAVQTDGGPSELRSHTERVLLRQASGGFRANPQLLQVRWGSILTSKLECFPRIINYYSHWHRKTHKGHNMLFWLCSPCLCEFLLATTTKLFKHLRLQNYFNKQRMTVSQQINKLWICRIISVSPQTLLYQGQ